MINHSLVVDGIVYGILIAVFIAAILLPYPHYARDESPTHESHQSTEK